MTRSLITIVLALLISTIVAAPVKQLRKRSFKIHRREVPNYVPNGPAALKRAYLKFGLGDIESKPFGEVDTAVKAAANETGNANNENGETPAVGTQNDAQFLSPITIGGQELVVNFDSGSSDLWVFNANLPAAAKRGRNFFDQTKSQTFKADTQSSFSIRYGDESSASGPVGFDTVDIGGSTVENQAIGLPDFVSASFIRDTASSGLIGLGFSSINTIKPQQQKTFFDNVAGDLSQPVFTAQLKGGTVGAYEFGTIDTSAFTGELAQVPVDDSNGFWQFQSNKVIVNGKTTQIKGSAIADTGTSLMLVGDDMLKAYWSQVEGAINSRAASGFIFPCDAQLPDLEVAAGDDYMALVPGVNMNFATVGQDANGVTMCFGGLQSNRGSKISIYGDVWFKSQFVAFQADGPSLGIAPHA